MRFLPLLSAGILAPLAVLAAPTSYDTYDSYDVLSKRENLCNLKEPPVTCQPNATVSVEETARRAYQFYRAFVVDGDPRTMFSLIDSVYKVSPTVLQCDYSLDEPRLTHRSKTRRDMRAARRPFGPFSATGRR
jgi:hypothetical protein